MDDRKLKEHICKELMDMADEWEIEMERWAEKHPEEDRELCRMGNPDFIAAGVADRENMCYDKCSQKRSKEEPTMYAEFDESLVTGNEMIDGQHKELIDKINKLVACCEQGGGKLEAIKMLDYLSDYTEFHFGAEEKLQEEISYPGIEEHRKQHADFKQAVSELHEMLEEEEGPSDAFVAAVNKNVIDWLYRHIKGFDRSVAEYKNMKAQADRL